MKKKKIISNLKKKKNINNSEYILVDTINYDLTKITLDLLKKNNHITERFIPIDLSIFIKQIENLFKIIKIFLISLNTILTDQNSQLTIFI